MAIDEDTSVEALTDGGGNGAISACAASCSAW